jgi:hypothetical protein
MPSVVNLAQRRQKSYGSHAQMHVLVVGRGGQTVT